MGFEEFCGGVFWNETLTWSDDEENPGNETHVTEVAF